MKSPFPFDPLNDSLLGKILGDIAENKKEREVLWDAIESHSSSGQFFFTSNANKQILMNTLPVQLRAWIEEKDLDKLKEELTTLIQGSLKKSQAPAMDVFLELAEWIVTGFEDNSLKLEILNLFTNYKYPIEENVLLQIQQKYDETLKEDFGNGK